MEGFLSGIEKLAIDEMKEASMEQPCEPSDNYGQSRQIYSWEIRIMIKPWSSRSEIVIKKFFGLRVTRSPHAPWRSAESESKETCTALVRVPRKFHSGEGRQHQKRFHRCYFYGKTRLNHQTKEVLVQAESISNKSATGCAALPSFHAT